VDDAGMMLCNFLCSFQLRIILEIVYLKNGFDYVLFILLFIFFGKQITIAQEWQSYHVESYAPYFWWAGELPLKQQFKINFYEVAFGF
jgi:hypothetical protein